MKQLMIKGLVVSILAMSASVCADEVWETTTGRIVYESEIGPTAVWSYGTQSDPGVIYLLGLAKVYENRGSYNGYWAKHNSPKRCGTSRPGMLGEMTPFWGRFNVKFIDKNFPSRWEASWSYCDGEYEAMKVEAQPLVGDGGEPDAKSEVSAQ